MKPIRSLRFLFAGPSLLALLAATLLVASGCDTSPVEPVVYPPIASLEVSPDADTLRAGQLVLFRAVAKDSSDNVVTGVPITWASSDMAIFTVDSNGRVRGIAEGTALLTATRDAGRDSAWVTVLPAQDGWFQQYTSTFGEDYYGIFFQPDGRHGCVVGSGGRIVTTDNGGTTWTTRASGTIFALRAVWFTSMDVGWAVGAGGTVLKTSDRGVSWSRVNAGSGELIRDICFATPDSGWAVGSGGLVLRTTNGGQTWERRFPTGFNLNSISFAGRFDGWAVGDAGVIVGTHDGGASWFIVQPAITVQSLRSVWRRSASMAVAAGVQGVTPRTVVGPDSTTWQLANAGAANALEGVFFPTDAIGFVVGYNGGGAILRSDDGGSSWVPQTANTLQRLNDVFFVDGERGWAVADNGVILHTGTGGRP